ncbi:dynamin family protein [Nocardioides dongxiaopingii]|uniref:dynamin family protein n=1 Tax=Nocardioides dongxiaopingii TaxID=2576036 RepID=UPI0014850377|nr:dynamin family protein [Nocardioides dongxiaopingii]
MTPPSTDPAAGRPGRHGGSDAPGGPAGTDEASTRLQDKRDAAMVTALVRLRQSLVAAALPLDLPDVAEARASRGEMVDQLEDYLIPRLMTLEAPLLAVVGGSTGAGKSTLVNSLVGERVTTSGVLRPTTRSPVLVHHPDDAHWFGQDRLLPGLVRVDHTTDDPDSLQLVASASVPQGLAILDAPDVDSVEERNRLLAAELMAAADLWLFVTSAARYADQVPWEFLRRAAERTTAVAIILDRTPDEAVQTVATHLARMLASRGLKDSPLFVVAEGTVGDDGLLPAHHVADVRSWLESLADDVDARTEVVRRTLGGAVRAITHRIHAVADACAAQGGVALALQDDVDAVYDDATAALTAALGDGSLVRGDLQARWEEFVGSGDLLRSLDTRVGGLRERLVNTIKGKPQQAERVTVAVDAALQTVVLEHAESAATRAHAAWSAQPHGAALLAGAPGDLTRASRDLRRRAERAVREWQDDVNDLVRREGADRRTSARFLAFGVGGLSVALMVEVLTSDAGAGAADAGAAETAGPASASRRLLDAVLGHDDVDTLVERARRGLDRLVGALMQTERTRYLSLVEAVVLEPAAAEKLRGAARRVDDLRYQASQEDAVTGENPPGMTS